MLEKMWFDGEKNHKSLKKTQKTKDSFWKTAQKLLEGSDCWRIDLVVNFGSKVLALEINQAKIAIKFLALKKVILASKLAWNCFT